MANNFSWKPEYSVGVPAFDDQHKTIINLLNELQDALNRGEGLAVAEQLLNTLVRYTEYHFGAEERMMEQHQFAGLAEHRLEHQLLTRRVLAAKRSLQEQKNTLLPVSLLFFLKEWLNHHILVVDKAYMAALTEPKKADSATAD